MAREINAKSVFLSAAGGVLDFVSQDGELLASVAVPPGRVPARDYLDLLPEGAAVEVSEGLVVLQPRSGFGVQHYGQGSHETGANPDFRPTSASRNELEMRLTLARMQAVTSRVEARERALWAVERIPAAPAPAPAPAPADDVAVIE